jgi:hypothetical protein
MAKIPLLLPPLTPIPHQHRAARALVAAAAAAAAAAAVPAQRKLRIVIGIIGV